MERSAVHRPGPPFSARHQITLADPRPVYWRARFIAAGSRTTGVSPTQRYTPQLSPGRLVMAAASCAQLWQRRATGARPAARRRARPTGDSRLPGRSRLRRKLAVLDYIEAPDFYFERFTRTLSDPHFETVRRRGRSVSPAMTTTTASRTMRPVAVPDLVPAAVEPCPRRPVRARLLRLPVRRRSLLDARWPPLRRPRGTAGHAGQDQAGTTQRDWLESTLATTDASLAVVYSADIFASRSNPDCFLFGWPDEYRRLMTAFMDAQLRGVRVVILSGDAHGLRIHHHPDPAARTQAAGLSIVEFVCSGLSPRSWDPATVDDETLDPQRSVMHHRGLGMIDIDPAGTQGRSVTLRAISGDEGDRPTSSHRWCSTTRPPRTARCS